MTLQDLFPLTEPLQVMDVGAACIAETPVYAKLVHAGMAQLTAFEGDPRHIAKIKATYQEHVTVHTDFLGDGLVHSLYVAHPDSGMTSLLKPDVNALKFFNQFEHIGKTESIQTVQTRRLDDCPDIPTIDFLKMDIQGAELMVLHHGPNTLRRCVAIQLEVSYTCLYEKQPTFGEVDTWMRAQGFAPHCFLDVKRWSIAPTIKDGNFRLPFNQLLESDVVYIRDPLQLAVLDSAQLKNLAHIAHSCFASYDLVVKVLLELVARGEAAPDMPTTYVTTLRAVATVPATNLASPIIGQPTITPGSPSMPQTLLAPLTPLWAAYANCPLCGSRDLTPLRSDRCAHHPMWQPALPQQMDWLHCPQCEHIFTKTYFTPDGLALLLGRAHAHQIKGQDLDNDRQIWSPTVERVVRQLAASPWSVPDTLWLDVGCGSGGLVMTAAEYGFTAIGVDTRAAVVQAIESFGYRAVLGDLNSLEVTEPVQVISLADVLEHVAFPRQALKRVWAALKPGGMLMVSCPNLDCASWRQSNADGTNPYWSEMEHCHNFSRTSLMRLLSEEGFDPVEYSISPRYKSCMEVIARKRA